MTYKREIGINIDISNPYGDTEDRKRTLYETIHERNGGEIRRKRNITICRRDVLKV